MRPYPRLVMAGTYSGVGKTTATLSILAALRERGRTVQPFKAGPDFIDPSHHRAATGRPSHNLDGWMLGNDVNRSIFARAAVDADISIIEGMMGLFDGSSPLNDLGSTAELAKQLEAPVILVVDGSAMARSAAAMVAGYARFDPTLRVAGVLFNRVGSDAHYQLLKTAVEQDTDVVAVGYLRHDSELAIGDRHLGLVMAMEEGSEHLYRRLAKAALDTVDLDRIEALAQACKSLSAVVSQPVNACQRRTVRIGVAQDHAFCFYYPDNLDALEAAGGEIHPFSPLHDDALPDVEMLYLGGGYPELYGETLTRNIAMRAAIKRFAEGGGLIYAECGGLMYLTESIRDGDGQSHTMVGVFPAETVMRKTGLTLGYRNSENTRRCILGDVGVTVRGHEFHYSTLVARGPLHYACGLSDAEGRSKGQDGLMSGHVLALYTHLHFASQPTVAVSLIESAARAASHVNSRPRQGRGANG